MGWRLAESLKVLLAEANAACPTRRKGYDGTIGDAAHAARASRHNPNNYGVVCALDLTHDPERGMDTYDLFHFLRLHPHPDLAYVISNRRVARRNHLWAVEEYHGSSAHDRHIHIAVGGGNDSEPTQPYDDTDSWRLSEWRDDMTEEQVEQIVKRVLAEQTEQVFDPSAISTAQNALVKAGIISKPRTAGKVPSWGLVALALSRALKK